MTRLNFAAILAACALSSTPSLRAELPLAVHEPKRTEPVDFATEILPLLKRNCLACHHQKQPEGGLVLETLASIHAGGDSGESVIKGDADASPLFLRATGIEEPLMPPEDNSVGAVPLSAAELGLLKLWIVQGADGSDAMQESAIEWQPIPESLRAVYAIDVSPDGQWLAFNRGNRVLINDFTTGEEVAKLVDPSLSAGPVADVDLVQSIAFSPDGNRIATGGFRTVRIWKRAPRTTSASSGLLSRAVGPVAGLDAQDKLAFVDAIGDIEVIDTNSGQQRVQIPATTDPLVALAWNDTEQSLFGVTARGYLAVWDGNTGEKIAETETLTNVSGLDVSAKSGITAILNSDRTIDLYMLPKTDVNETLHRTQQKLGDIENASSIVWIDAEPPSLAVGQTTNTIALINPANGKVIRSLDHASPIASLAVTSDAMHLVSGGADGTTKVWKVADGELVSTLTGSREDQLLIAQTQAEQTRLTATVTRLTDLTVSLREAVTKEQEALAKVSETRDKAAEALTAVTKKKEDAVAAVTESEKKLSDTMEEIKRLTEALEKAKADAEATTKAIETKKNAVTDIEPEVVKATTELMNREQAVVAAQGAQSRAEAAIPLHEQRIEAANRDVQLATLRLEQTQQASKSLGGSVIDVAVDTKNEYVAALREDGSAIVYQITTARPVASFASAVATRYHGATFLDGSLIRYARQGPALAVEMAFAWTLERTIGEINSDTIPDRVTALAFHRDGNILAVGSGVPSRSGTVLVYAVDTGHPLRHLGEVHSDSVLDLEFSPDGRTLASAAADKTIRLIDVASASVVRNLEGHTHHVLALAWHPHGETLASGSADGTVKIWNSTTGEVTRTISGFPKEVTAVRFVDATNQLLAATAGGQVRLANIDNGSTVRNFDASGDFIHSATRSTDASKVIAGGQSGHLRIWNLADGKLLSELP